MGTNTAVARQVARPWVGPVARIGLATKGVLYLLIGGLAVLWAADEGGKVSDGHGAVRTLRDLPYGTILLVSAAIGLAAYALWRFLQAAIDLDRKSGWKGAAKRIGYAFSGAIYAGLAWTALELARGHHAADHSQEKKSLVASALSKPYGDVFIVLVGVGFGVYGAVQLWKAITASFEKHLALGRLTWRQRVVALWVGRIGTAARGIVFGVIGYQLIRAGIRSSASETRDIAGALRTLAQRPHGDLILGVIAGGLFLYGVFMLTRAWVGRIPGSDGG
jgi:uncharacterized membrane protein YidH (DUF202 family)